MSRPGRELRSLLYAPGHRADLLDAAFQSEADAVIVDLEDSVPAGDKVTARSALRSLLARNVTRPQSVVIRINAFPEGGIDDVVAIGDMPVTAVLLPKAETPAAVQEAAASLDDARSPASLWLMVETAAAVLDVRSLVTASPRVGALVVGYGDLAKGLGARFAPLESPLATCALLCLLAGRATGALVYDGVNLEAGSAFTDACRQAAAAGYDGKTVLSAMQANLCNGGFDETRQPPPSIHDIETAARKSS